MPVIPNRGAAKFKITAFLLMFYYILYRQIAIYNQLKVSQNFFWDLKSATN